MHELVAEYDGEKDSDSDEQRMQRFDKIMFLMQKMQMCGHPPAELVGDLVRHFLFCFFHVSRQNLPLQPPGWGFDSATGMPTVVDPDSAAQEGCCLM